MRSKTLSFFIARIVFFRLHESPRYLVHAGRHEEALLNLQKISRFNGSELSLDLGDVCDQRLTESPVDEERAPFIRRNEEPARTNVRVIFDADARGERPPSSEREPLAVDNLAGANKPLSPLPDRVHYDSTGSSEVPLDAHTFITPATEAPPRIVGQGFPSPNIVVPGSPEPKEDEDEEDVPPARRRPERPIISKHARRSSLYEAKAKVYWALPRRIRKPLWAWLDKIGLVLGPEWRRTTLLVWAMWCSMALGKTACTCDRTL